MLIAASDNVELGWLTDSVEEDVVVFTVDGTGGVEVEEVPGEDKTAVVVVVAVVANP